MKLIVVLLSLIFCWKQVNGQEFYEDGSMKLFEISKNKKYGYTTNHKIAIKVGEIKNEQPYLSSLRGPNGEKVQFRRISSCCHFKSKSAVFGSGLLDKYEVYYKGLEEPIILYLNPYDFDTPKAPVGFTFVTPEKIEKPVIYSTDDIMKVNFCNEEKQYAVGSEHLLEEEIGEKKEPKTTPTFKGGIDELRKYFAQNPLTDERAKESIFRVKIAFVVDCKGNAGNYKLITKGKGLLETFANQILEIVNKMPNEWIPATKNGDNVDCYQVLSFSVWDGKLDKVSYR